MTKAINWIDQTIQIMIDNQEEEIEYFIEFYVEMIDKKVNIQQHSQILAKVSKLTNDFLILQKYLRLLEK